MQGSTEHDVYATSRSLIVTCHCALCLACCASLQTLVSAIVARAVGAGAAKALQLLDELLPRLHEQTAFTTAAAAAAATEGAY
jgi:hypothetical protein